MRMSRKTGLLVSSAVCGALALGAAGTALASIDDTPARPGGVTASDAPLPEAESIAEQARSLALASGVLKPVTDLITSVLGVPGGKLWPGQADRLATAVRDAVDAARQTSPAPPVVPLVTPAAPAVPPASKPDNGRRAKPGGAAALKENALAALQTRADALLKASAAGDPAAITRALRATVAGLVNVLVSTTLGSGLPAPDLPGLPALPQLRGEVR
ncbi:hypothetical protein FCH28_33430 [Streptomyces piniterrae]|uniref:Secreted protein n=1 Tax=Streptomyces piniterrae TaxID=2571125 RepID=A0A4U0MPV9_9ACTN|nr:hypothetical protein [Streptomyces piniterrae]TJZ42799.1 hypothetical protein FCH28_33430 [Streptomyces piniterrae]